MAETGGPVLVKAHSPGHIRSCLAERGSAYKRMALDSARDVPFAPAYHIRLDTSVDGLGRDGGPDDPPRQSRPHIGVTSTVFASCAVAGNA